MYEEVSEMNKNISGRVTVLIAAVLIMLTFASSAFAEGGNGDGTGGGKDKPLALESSSIANGAKNVSLTPEIVLNFNKNVVHFTVKENNMKCFSMTESGGKAVPVDVIMGDDQVDPSIKRTVTIKPKSSLEPETTYILKIGKDITSKSGVNLGKDYYISFTTGGQGTPPATTTTTTKATTAKPSTTKSRVSGGSAKTTVPPAATTTVSEPQTEVTTPAENTANTTRAQSTTARAKTTKAPSTTKQPSTSGTTASTVTKSNSSVTVTVSMTAVTTVPGKAGESVTFASTEPAVYTVTESSAEESVSIAERHTSANDGSEEKEETDKHSKNTVIYIIAGAIAAAAVPAVALTIKKFNKKERKY